MYLKKCRYNYGCDCVNFKDGKCIILVDTPNKKECKNCPFFMTFDDVFKDLHKCYNVLHNKYGLYKSYNEYIMMLEGECKDGYFKQFLESEE